MTFKGEDGKDVRELDQLIKNEKCVIGVFADWCGACKMMKPEWDAFLSECKTTHSNKPWTICSVYHPMNNSSKSKCFQSVKGFPTIMCVDKDRVVANYQNDRTANNFIEFCNANMDDAPTDHLREVDMGKRDKLDQMVKRVVSRIRTSRRARKATKKRKKKAKSRRSLSRVSSTRRVNNKKKKKRKKRNKKKKKK